MHSDLDQQGPNWKDVLPGIMMALRMSPSTQKLQYDKKAVDHEFRVGEWVLLRNNKVPRGLSPEFHKPWDGPFYIARQGLNNTYKIIRCSNNKALKSPIHANRLKSYNNPAHRRHLDPPPAAQIIDDTHLSSDNYGDEDRNPIPANLQGPIINNAAKQPLQAPGEQPSTPPCATNTGASTSIPPDPIPGDTNNPQPFVVTT